ncbi:MAG: DUF502 domain-containing protein [Hyphomicrobiaceae bacterium]|nr:DUF502 domain-containing protein [Hyphomicrobiaceae bacterium]
MGGEQNKDQVAQPAHWRASLIARIRNYFLAGIIFIGPLAITFYLARMAIDWVDATIKPYLPSTVNPDTYLPFAVPGFGLLAGFLALTALGYLATNVVGRSMLSLWEQMLERLPVLRSIYRTLKQLFETVLADREANFKQAALIEWPRAGLWSIVFITADARGEIGDKLGGEGDDELVSVFIPTTPNPTGGYLMFARKRDIILLDMSVEDAIKLVISGGLVVPEPAGEAAPPPALAEPALALDEAPAAPPHQQPS